MVFFFQAEDGIRDLVRSRGLGDVYKRQVSMMVFAPSFTTPDTLRFEKLNAVITFCGVEACSCLLYTSDAADERSSVDLGGRRIITKTTIEQEDRGMNT